MKRLFLLFLSCTALMYAPRFDGTGPAGKGARTGRVLGSCLMAGQGGHCAACPFIASFRNDSIEALEAKEAFLKQMLAIIKTEKARRE